MGGLAAGAVSGSGLCPTAGRDKTPVPGRPCIFPRSTVSDIGSRHRARIGPQVGPTSKTVTKTPPPPRRSSRRAAGSDPTDPSSVGIARVAAACGQDSSSVVQADGQALPSGSHAERSVQSSRRQEYRAANARGPRAEQASKLETRALFARSQGGTVARAGGNPCAPLSVHHGTAALTLSNDFGRRSSAADRQAACTHFGIVSADYSKRRANQITDLCEWLPRSGRARRSEPRCFALLFRHPTSGPDRWRNQPERLRGH